MGARAMLAVFAALAPTPPSPGRGGSKAATIEAYSMTHNLLMMPSQKSQSLAQALAAPVDFSPGFTPDEAGFLKFLDHQIALHPEDIQPADQAQWQRIHALINN